MSLIKSLRQVVTISLIALAWLSSASNNAFAFADGDSDQAENSGSSRDAASRTPTNNKTAPASATGARSTSTGHGGTGAHTSPTDDQRSMKKIKQKEKEKENIILARRTIRMGSDESCDWRTQPLEKIRGEVCGAHYKVLGLDRKKLTDIDKTFVKKKYRQISLSVHPDKNPASEATEAFKIVTNAYECLLDDSCRYNYDAELNKAEERISVERKQIKSLVVERMMTAVNHVHYYFSVACMHVYQTGLDLWELAGEFEYPLFGEARPVGKWLMLLGLMWRGRWLLQLHGMSYLVVRANIELAKHRGLI